MILDVKDPSNPTLVGRTSFEPHEAGKAHSIWLARGEMPSTRNPDPGPGFWGVHDPKVRGNTLYLSYFAEGLVVADIRRPGQPEQVGQFTPSAPDPTGFFCPGAECAATWGVVLHGNLILLGDTISGLWVLERT